MSEATCRSMTRSGTNPRHWGSGGTRQRFGHRWASLIGQGGTP
ncbi:MAG: hypothetical protein JWQ49_6594 [Edaphobacter sp.]|nr:hypothetical protein [Edaphobacter sp.]